MSNKRNDGSPKGRDKAIVEGIERGLADMAAGELVSHESAMAEVDAAIDRIATESSPPDAPNAPISNGSTAS